MLKALIVEDEYLAREELTYLIQTYSDIEIVATFEDGLEAFKYLQSNKVDIAFLDIQVPSIDGMLLARNIHQFAQKPHIVFTTAYKEFAVDAFELEAFDYLLKPMSEERVKGLLSKLEATHQSRPEPKAETKTNTLNLHKDGRICITSIDKVRYAEASEKVTKVFTDEGEFIAQCSISELMEKLADERFFRTHRSYLVNLEKIKEIIPWMNSTYLLKLGGIETQIPVSRGNLKAFRQRMAL